MSRKRCRAGLFVLVILLWFSIVLHGGISPISAQGVTSEVWYDDFNEGSYINWTVTQGLFSAADGTLRGVGSGPHWIHRNSTVANGTWNFDIYHNGTDHIALWFICNTLDQSFNYNPGEGYRLLIERDRLKLQLAHSGSIDTIGTNYGENFFGWWNFTVTREVSGEMDVFINGVLMICTMDNTFSTSNYFCFLAQGPHAIDNIRVLNSVEPPEFTLIRTTDTTTTTTETSPTSSTDITSPPTNPPDIIVFLMENLGVSVAMGIAVFAFVTGLMLRYLRHRDM